MMSSEKFIDIENVIASKNPKLLKSLPGFIIRYLKRILHEDEINQFMAENGHFEGIDFAHQIISNFGVTIQLIHPERIPDNGRFVLTSNHPLGGFDGIALISSIGKYRNNIKFIVNDLLLFITNLKPVFIPVNKHGANSKDSIRKIDEAFAGSEFLMTFPFGLVSRKKRGKIKDLEWKKSFLVKAKQHKRDILPVHVSGKNSNFFYNLSNLRKFFGIKANIEMLYLPDEMFKQKGKIITITIGNPIPVATFDSRHNDVEWAEKLRIFTYELEKNPDAVFS